MMDRKSSLLSTSWIRARIGAPMHTVQGVCAAAAHFEIFPRDRVFTFTFTLNCHLGKTHHAIA